jgi:hypothetical protein
LLFLACLPLGLPARVGGDHPNPAGPVKPKVAELRFVGPPRPAPDSPQVNWHASFAAARKAAQETGKPVLLFHLVGRLDEEFL